MLIFCTFDEIGKELFAKLVLHNWLQRSSRTSKDKSKKYRFYLLIYGDIQLHIFHLPINIVQLSFILQFRKLFLPQEKWFARTTSEKCIRGSYPVIGKHPRNEKMRIQTNVVLILQKLSEWPHT